MLDNMMKLAIERAIAKREQIIAREGDLDGKRLSLDYLSNLTIEEYKVLILKEELENGVKAKKFGVA